MTDEPMIDKLERLEREATPGPWNWRGNFMAQGSERTYAGYPQRITGRNPDDTDTSPVLVAECFDGEEDRPAANAAVIVAMRNALPSLLSQLREAQGAKDHAYWERNQLVRVLSVMYPSYIALSDDPDWPIVYVELPTGQASWHIPATEIPTFSHLEWEPAAWDGHTDDEKYARLAALAPNTEGEGTCRRFHHSQVDNFRHRKMDDCINWTPAPLQQGEQG